MDRKGKASFEDKTKPLSQHIRLHPETIKNKSQSFSIHETKHPSIAKKHNEKTRPVSTRATTYLQISSTTVINIRIEVTSTTPYSDMYHEKQEAIYNTNLIIGVNVALVVFLMIIAILGFAIWRKAHRSRRQETFRVIERRETPVPPSRSITRDTPVPPPRNISRDTPVPPPRNISSKENKETTNRSSDDTYDIICDVVDKDIDNSVCQHDQRPMNLFDNNQTDRTYMEFIGEESTGLSRSTCIPFRSGSQTEPDPVTLKTEDNCLLPVQLCLPHTIEHYQLETGNGIGTTKPANCVKRENIFLERAMSNDEISNNIYYETSV